MSFGYEASPDPIRSDLADAHRRVWEHIAAPGTWLTGAERVAVADETRRARGCALCRERKEALSPFSVEGEHDHAGVLAAPMVDQIHRVTTDAARLTESWYRSLLEQGLTADAYVEALGVAVVVISVDRFHHALGLPLEPLPRPTPGEPTRVRPEDVVEGEAWVPMRESRRVSAELGLPAGQAPFVLRALSLVPAEVRAWNDLSAAQYLGLDDMRSFERVRAIDRSQIELVAGRVSALNECFY
jgi:alkylhydroperoxidase family enzyme